MHQVCIGRQAIYDRELKVHAYELLYRRDQIQNAAGDIDDDHATAQVVINAFLEFGLEQLVGQHPAFINLPRKFIVGEIPLPFSGEHVVLEILEDVEINNEVISGVKKLRALGYQIALDDFVYHESLRPLVESCDIVKLDLLALSRDDVRMHVAELRVYDVKLLAEKVERQEDFDFALELGFDYFQGYFFCRPAVVAGNSLPGNRLAVLRLLAKIQEPKIKVAELAELVSQDVGLSFKLLRWLNSALYNLRKPIESIHHAIVYLGIENVKNWVSLIALAQIPGKPEELMLLTLIRAKMCEQFWEKTGLPKEMLFTVGLFSTLDAFMDAPIGNLLSQLPLATEIKEAVLHKQGPAGTALRCALAYERGDWQSPDIAGFEVVFLTQAYFDAVRWADETSRSVK